MAVRPRPQVDCWRVLDGIPNTLGQTRTVCQGKSALASPTQLTQRST